MVGTDVSQGIPTRMVSLQDELIRPVLGVHVSADINEGIFATRKPDLGNNYLHKWNTTTEAWDAVTSVGSPTMVGVSKVRFESFNWGAPKFAMADGVNPASTWDGTTYVQLNGGQSPSAPSLSCSV